MGILRAVLTALECVDRVSCLGEEETFRVPAVEFRFQGVSGNNQHVSHQFPYHPPFGGSPLITLFHCHISLIELIELGLLPGGRRTESSLRSLGSEGVGSISFTVYRWQTLTSAD